jgi:hypothetical protein
VKSQPKRPANRKKRPNVPQLLKKFGGVRLDLGCGPSKQAGFLGIDARDLPGVDIVHDLEVFPWPLPPNCARAVVISHFWEHIKPWLTMKFMEELHRVCIDQASVFLSGPYSMQFRYVQDPTHCNPSNEATFLYWDNNSDLWGVYKPPIFHMDAYAVVPIGGWGKDFNAVLRVCKQYDPKEGTCPHKVKY